MTDDPPPLTPELLDEYIHRVDQLIHGFTEREDSKDIFGAPDFHGLTLCTSRDFWSGRSSARLPSYHCARHGDGGRDHGRCHHPLTY